MKQISLAFAEQETVVKCLGCYTVLLELKCIDQFISYEHKIDKKQQKNQVKQQFFVLHSNSFPNGSLQVSNKPAKSSSNIIGLSFLKDITCVKCCRLIGYQVYSVSSQNQFLLDRSIISKSEIFVGNEQQNQVQKLINIIKQSQHIQQAEIQPQKGINTKKKQKFNQNIKPKQNQSREKIIKRNLLQQLSQHKEKLIYDAQISNEQIKQIIQTMQFFGDVLEKLDQRVSDVQTVCNVIKRKVQKVIPLIRKKQNQYQ